MHRIPLQMPTPSVLWDRSLPEYILFERTLFTRNVKETEAFMQVLDEEADFYKNQCYGIAEDMFCKAESFFLERNPASFGEGMALINSIILRTPKDCVILACALKIRGNLYYYDCSFEFASNDYEMFLEVNKFKECPKHDTCEVVGNLTVCMYMRRQHLKAKKYLRLYKKYKAKLSPEILQRNCFEQIETHIEKFMCELNDVGNTIQNASNTDFSKLSKEVIEHNNDNSSTDAAVGHSIHNTVAYSNSDVQKADVLFVDYPVLQSLNAPFVKCEVCYVETPGQVYTCLECRYKTYCSLGCMEKDKTVHTKDECLGYQQLTLILLDASNIFRVFQGVVKQLHDHIFKQKIFRKNKTAIEVWYNLLKGINEIKIEPYNQMLSFITMPPQYERLMENQYSTLVATAFRLAIFIATKTNLIEDNFSRLTLSPKQKLIIVGSLLMRIHCNILLNTYDFDIQTDYNTEGLQADVQPAYIVTGIRVEDLNKYYNINMETDIWQRSLNILKAMANSNSSATVTSHKLPTNHHTQMCVSIHRLLSVYKDNIAEIYFNPELIQEVMYGPTAGQPNNPFVPLAICARLTDMTDVQRCYFLKRFARLFHSHYVEYFTQMGEFQLHQIVSLFSPALSKFRHSCNPNVEIIVLNNGMIIGKALRDIAKGEQLYVSFQAHYMRHTRKERQKFLQCFNINCQCIYCKINDEEDLVNLRQAIYCESCPEVEITPQHSACPKCNNQYSNLLTKYRTIINIFEDKLADELKSHSVPSEREIYILQYIIYSYAQKYFVPQNEYRIRCELKYVRYLALKNFAQQSYNLLMQIRDNILQSYSEHFIWFTFYADILQIIKIILRFNVTERLYTISSKMLLKLCDLGLYIIRGQLDLIDFYEIFDRKCFDVMDDLSILTQFKDKIVCDDVTSLVNFLGKSEKRRNKFPYM